MYGAILSALRRPNELAGRPTRQLHGFIIGLHLASAAAAHEGEGPGNAENLDRFRNLWSEHQKTIEVVWGKLPIAEIEEFYCGFLIGIQCARNPSKLKRGPFELYTACIHNKKEVNRLLREGGEPALRAWLESKLPKNLLGDAKYLHTIIHRMKMPCRTRGRPSKRK